MVIFKKGFVLLMFLYVVMFMVCVIVFVVSNDFLVFFCNEIVIERVYVLIVVS